MTLPDFVILGAQKAGTTWLAHQLRQHKQVFMPSREVHFFDVPENYDKGIEWYQSHFDSAIEGQIVGEKTPDYFWTYRGTEFHGKIYEHIKQVLPDARFIVTLRNPVSRTISAINHHINMGRLSTRNDLEKTLLESSKRGITKWGLLERGHYARELGRFLEVFPREQLLVLFYEEDIKDRPLETLNLVEEFLGLDHQTKEIRDNRPINASRRTISFAPLERALPFVRPLTTRLSKAVSKSSPYWRSSDLERQLAEYFAPRNEELYTLLDRNTDRWK